MTAPIIVLGMHRSGTTMVARLLSHMGVFMGADVDANHESRLFQGLNDWLLTRAGARWDEPAPFDRMLADARFVAVQADYLATRLAGPARLRYLGWRRSLLSGGRLQSAGPWGWKDPRNALSLPVWLALYPSARLVHVRRHGVDVARSLVTRSQRSRALTAQNFYRRRWMHRFVPKRGGFVDSPRCLEADGAMDLWCAYLDRVGPRLGAAAEAGLTVVDLHYEDLLAAPAATLGRLAGDLALPVSDSGLAALAERVNPQRRFAYRDDPDWLQVAARYQSLLARYGYAA